MYVPARFNRLFWGTENPNRLYNIKFLWVPGNFHTATIDGFVQNTTAIKRFFDELIRKTKEKKRLANYINIRTERKKDKIHF